MKMTKNLIREGQGNGCRVVLVGPQGLSERTCPLGAKTDEIAGIVKDVSDATSWGKRASFSRVRKSRNRQSQHST
jgi:hypothetical protein